MKVLYKDFNQEAFSFQNDPVLVLEEFWTPEDTAFFRNAMKQAKWKKLLDLPAVSRAFPNAGNWLKGDVEQNEREVFFGKINLPCVENHIDSFPNIKQRHLNLNYYSYGVGDCLPTHDDTDEAYVPSNLPRPPLRRLAMVAYFHEEWQPDWGGELIVYGEKKDNTGKKALDIVGCVAPKPRSLAMFTVPRHHRVCRIDPLAGDHRRQTIVTWFMTEHFG
ncbi:MAG: 2OG-Fe(II) oxygenase family protein [Nitrospinota bacterium]|nr:2OG-Fe(II) oxygenase family protein [Nitrospinota bacterium]